MNAIDLGCYWKGPTTCDESTVTMVFCNATRAIGMIVNETSAPLQIQDLLEGITADHLLTLTSMPKDLTFSASIVKRGSTSSLIEKIAVKTLGELTEGEVNIITFSFNAEGEVQGEICEAAESLLPTRSQSDHTLPYEPLEQDNSEKTADDLLLDRIYLNTKYQNALSHEDEEVASKYERDIKELTHWLNQRETEKLMSMNEVDPSLADCSLDDLNKRLAAAQKTMKQLSTAIRLSYFTDNTDRRLQKEAELKKIYAEAFQLRYAIMQQDERGRKVPVIKVESFNE